MYLERRYNSWLAFHDIPADVQQALGRKRFSQSLKTKDPEEAKRRAAVLEASWRSAIESARSKSGDHVERDAIFWRKLLNDAPDAQQAMIRDAIGEEAQRRAERALAKAGIMLDASDPLASDVPGVAEAERFLGIATGKLVKLDEHLDEYLGTLKNEAKTVDMKRSTITKFAEGFPYVADVQRKAVQKWINARLKDGKSVETVRRYMSEMRGYWGYLISIEVVSEDVLPLEKLSYPTTGKNGNGDEREAFAPADVVKLHSAALGNEDQHLADLIELAMWTGARLEELCALRVEKVGRDAFTIEDAKTKAGWREVPIHSKLKATVARLRKASTDGYLLSGLPTNKYGDRSNAVGKRFGYLKTRLGFAKDKHVFHSIRRTVATLLENAGVTENVSAGILGHDIPTMTYGLYSAGASLEVKRAAIEKIGYPGLLSAS